MRKSFSLYEVLLVCAILACAVTAQTSNATSKQENRRLPSLFLIGDSTVNNSGDGFQGWGNVIGDFFDNTKINVINRARGGRSSRTFYTEGLWDQVLTESKAGDYVLIQFGHNDGGPIDREKARGSLKGTGDETQEVTTEATGKKETVHTYGWYLRKYIDDAKAKGVTPIVLSPVPRNIWQDSRVVRASEDYGKWAAESAKAGSTFFVDLNEIIAKRYEGDGQKKVDSEYFTTKDHTHTSPAGARVSAELVVKGLKGLKKNPLKRYILNVKSQKVEK